MYFVSAVSLLCFPQIYLSSWFHLTIIVGNKTKAQLNYFPSSKITMETIITFLSHMISSQILFFQKYFS